MPATQSAWLGMPAGATSPAIQRSSALRSRRKCALYLLGIARPRARRRQHGIDHRVAVVFVQCRPHGGRRRGAEAFGNRRQRLRLPAQAADERGFEADAMVGEPGAELAALALAEFAEAVVVVGAERSLAMADEKKGSHGLRLCVATAAATGRRAQRSAR